MERNSLTQGKRSRTISVVVPTYNRAESLPLAIDSVVKQTEGNWELIIVDDGSTDSTKEVIRKYLVDSRISYFFQPNQGVSVARNTGLMKAVGNYVVFLDSDDFFAKDLIRSINSQIDDCPDLICWDVIKIINGKRKKWSAKKLSGIYNNIKATFLAGSVCYKKNLIIDFGGFDPVLKFGENYELGQRISGKKDLYIKRIDRALLYYILNTSERKSNSVENRLTSYIYQYKKHRKKYDQYPKVSAEMNYLIGFVLEKSNRRRAALKSYKRSWHNYPWNLKPLIKILYLRFL